MNVIVRRCGLTLVLAMAGCSINPVAPAAPPVSAAPTPEVTPIDPPPVVAAVSPPAVSGFGYRDAGQVCQRFTSALYSADTTRDKDAGAAWRRAAAYMSGALAAQSAAAARDGRWDLWRQHRARLETTTLLFETDPEAADPITAAGRTVRVTATPVGADGWRGPTENSDVRCELARAGVHDAWRVAEFRIEPVRSR
jgi:hypothetical protein